MSEKKNVAALPATSARQTVTSSFLLGNLHCPTCVSSIKEALQDSSGHIRWVSPNVVTSVVTVEHDAAVSLREMKSVLEDAGFEVCGVTTSGNLNEFEYDEEDDDVKASQSGNPGSGQENATKPSAATIGWWIGPSGLGTTKPQSSHSLAQAHLRNCEQCRKASIAHDSTHDSEPRDSLQEQQQQQQPPPSDTAIASPQPDPPRQQQMGISTMSSVAVDNSVALDGTAAADPPLWRITLAVGGMTCASCSNAITEELSKHEGVSSVAVNLVGNSAVVEFYKDSADELIEIIEDLGYEATVDTITDLAREKTRGKTARRTQGKSHEEMWGEIKAESGGESGADTQAYELEVERRAEGERTVEIKIDGIYCEHCPLRITRSLAGFRRELDIITPPTQQRPLITVSYVPDAPKFTIRQILAAIEAGDPALKASIYHPPTLEERSKRIQRKHQRQILGRVVFTGIVCIPTLIIGIVYMSLVSGDNASRQFLTAPWTSGISRAQIALFIMATPVFFFAADMFHIRAFKEIRTLWRRGSKVPVLQRFYRFGSMNMLMSLGTGIAYISSVSQLIAAAADKRASVDDSNFYFDSVVFLTFFLLLGRLIESYSKSRLGDAVELLGKLRPTTAVLVDGFGSDQPSDRTVQADLLDFGDVVRVPHGASPPADGIVVQGETNFDESSLTGESRPVRKAPGDEVFSGTVNQDAAVLVRITGVAGRSMLDRIVEAVREGQTKRAPMEQVADLLTTYFVPVITLAAILTWLLWLSFGVGGLVPREYLGDTEGGWVAFSLQFAIAVFVVACPCGLALAAPTAIFVGGGIAAKYGILAKGGGEAFEKASRVDCVVFDKTGTLTMGGEPTITDVKIYLREGDDTTGSDAAKDDKREDAEAELLAALKMVEQNSSHPVAKAIVAFCGAKTSSLSSNIEISALQELPGKGMKAALSRSSASEAATSSSFELAVGNEALMRDLSVAIGPRTTELLDKWKTAAKSVALVAISRPMTTPTWTLAAALAISDPIRPEAPPVVRALQAAGVRVWMLSGDNAKTAAAVAVQIGIPADQVIAGVLPTEKAAQITYLQSTLKARTWGGSPWFRKGSPGDGRRAVGEHATRRATIAMVGDGINDSPALAMADVGVAVGSGADVAISSADFVLVRSDLRDVPTLLALSRAVFGRVALNFGWALVYNVVAVPVAAGALYPIVSNGQHVRLDPVWASLAMALSSISVVLSSLALRSGIPGLGFRKRELVVPE